MSKLTDIQQQIAARLGTSPKPFKVILFGSYAYGNPHGEWRLTTDERKRILLNNIYGVDIDPQAVETTKLSLLLKVLEGEDEQTIGQQLLMFHGRVLPDLAKNIKCGNSLIGPDFYEGQQMTLLDEEETYRINAFDWQAEFPEIMKASGFDAVIGNPPYIRIQGMKEWAPIEVEHYKKAYNAAGKGNYDIYVVFVEKGLSLLNTHGVLGFILPHKFFNTKYGEPLRSLLAEGKHLKEIIHFGDQQVFSNATTYTCLLFLNKKDVENLHFIQAHSLPAWRQGEVQPKGHISTKKVTSHEWNFVVGPGAELFERLSEMPTKLGDIDTKVFQGLVTGADQVYIVEETERSEHDWVIAKGFNGDEWKLERRLLKPFLYHTTVSTFNRPVSRHKLIFPYHLANGKAVLNSEVVMSSSYPHAWEYLRHHSNILRNRERGKWNHERWYAYGRTQNLVQMEAPKLIVQVVALSARYAYDDRGIYFTGGGNGPYYGLRWSNPDNPHSLHYLQALLNSPLLDYYLHHISTTFRGGYWSYGKHYIEQLPIRTIDFNDPTEKARHDLMIDLVENMLTLHKKLSEAKIPQTKTVLQRQIETTDRQIDQLVYELYGLTNKEISIVEESAG